MHRIRIFLTSALGLAAVCALTPADSAAAATAAASPIAAVIQSDPPPEEPCPGGEPKPCGASNQERDSVDSGRQDAKKDSAQAKKDIAEAKEKTEKCSPGSAQGKQCMGDLLGAGAEQLEGIGAKERAGMDTAQEALDGLRPVPTDNAGPAVGATCEAFAADLPAMFTASGDLAELTGVCELMNR
ncbi:hypothetical protein AB0F17_11440 [Nonomuraea sp. NPDC026600]|uniref:hypothetical protein n=1 Tax=Nonomuraea sp. NPDC026600 TaxID=3155363 RepID=UPI003403F8EA